MKKRILLLMIFILTSCSNEPKKVVPTETTTTIEDRSKDKSHERKAKEINNLKDEDLKDNENSNDPLEEYEEEIINEDENE